jgi:hypothetical protein
LKKDGTELYYEKTPKLNGISFSAAIFQEIIKINEISFSAAIFQEI